MIDQFTCLTFGVNASSFVFIELLKPVFNLLRSNAFLSVVYLDDILSISKDFEGYDRNAKTTVQLLSSLGFLINWRKNVLVPSTRCKFLGFVLDSVNYSVALSKLKR